MDGVPPLRIVWIWIWVCGRIGFWGSVEHSFMLGGFERGFAGGVELRLRTRDIQLLNRIRVLWLNSSAGEATTRSANPAQFIHHFTLLDGYHNRQKGRRLVYQILRQPHLFIINISNVASWLFFSPRTFPHCHTMIPWLTTRSYQVMGLTRLWTFGRELMEEISYPEQLDPRSAFNIAWKGVGIWGLIISRVL